MKKKKVAMLVSNPASQDYRVNKEAESLARQGYEVRVYATWRPALGIPIRETINDVTYVRYDWNVLKVLRGWLLREPKYREIPRLARSHQRILDQLEAKK